MTRPGPPGRGARPCACPIALQDNRPPSQLDTWVRPYVSARPHREHPSKVLVRARGEEMKPHTIQVIGETTLTAKNQISLPAAGVRLLRWNKGDRLLVELVGDVIVL